MVQDRMAKIFFLSHSSEDGDIVKRVAKLLGRDRCWFYEWEVKPGDSIFQFDRGIADSRIFVLFWSANAANSPSVEDEVSQARIRISRDRGFRLVVVRLDMTQLPPALAYRSWIDGTKGIPSIVKALQRLEYELTPEETFVGKPILRDSFQNREREVDLLEKLALSGDSPVMILGLDGMGKTSLMKRAITAIFPHLTPVWVDLEVASTPIRLISAIAKPLSIQVNPHDAASRPEEIWHTVLLPEIQESQRLFIIFDNLQVPTVAGYSKGETILKLTETMCHDIVQLHKTDNPGVILISWTEPPFDQTTMSKFKSLELGPLDKKSIARVLRFYLTQFSSLEYDLDKLEKLAEHIGGYPAAVSAVAHRVAQQGIDATLADSTGLRKLRYTIAEDIFSRVSLSRDEKELLILFATSMYPLADRQLRLVLGQDLDYVESIRRKQLLDPTSQGYALHSILRDYVSESLAEPGDIMECHHKLARLFDREWRNALKLSAERAEFASLCYFHTLAGGGRRRAQLIQADYLEEAKAAAVELYRRGQYRTALSYLETARKMDSTRDAIYEFYYALCLNRLARSDEALDVINKLIARYPNVSRHYHALGTILRRVGNNEKALDAFRRAVALSSGRGKVTPLCSLADLLTSVGKPDEALPLIEEALDLEPGKSFVVATASIVYDAVGQTNAALDIIRDGLRVSPGDARLHHRAGMTLKKMGLLSEAKGYLERASRDPALGFSVTALADVYLELGEDDKAEEALERFPGNKQRSPSYLSTRANILRKKGDYSGSELLLKKAIRLEPGNVVLYGGLAQVKLDEAQSYIIKGDKQSALIRIDEAKNVISRGLEIEKQNETLLSIAHALHALELQARGKL